MLLLRSGCVIYGRAARSVGGGFCVCVCACVRACVRVHTGTHTARACACVCTHTGARSALSQYRIIYTPCIVSPVNIVRYTRVYMYANNVSMIDGTATLLCRVSHAFRA